jgi:hypothetical protein
MVEGKVRLHWQEIRTPAASARNPHNPAQLSRSGLVILYRVLDESVEIVNVVHGLTRS